MCPELEHTNQVTISHVFFNVIGLGEIQVPWGYFDVRFQESDEV